MNSLPPVKDWERVAENLARHQSPRGLYFQGLAGGKPIRRSLKTKNTRVAKVKRDECMLEARARPGSPARKDARAITIEEAAEMAYADFAPRPEHQKKHSSGSKITVIPFPIPFIMRHFPQRNHRLGLIAQAIEKASC